MDVDAGIGTSLDGGDVDVVVVRLTLMLILLLIFSIVFLIFIAFTGIGTFMFMVTGEPIFMDAVVVKVNPVAGLEVDVVVDPTPDVVISFDASSLGFGLFIVAAAADDEALLADSA